MMRAKMRVVEVKENGDSEELIMTAVCKNEYDETGNDENNTFAKWTPSANLDMHINNPNLHGKFEVGQEYYLDFTKSD
jgi:hypothetical protein